MNDVIRVLHSGDWHLGYRQYGYMLREGDFYTAAQRLLDQAVMNKVDAIILAGDNFDSAKPPALAVLVLQTLVKAATAAGIEVYGIDGNHDATEGYWLKICGVKPLYPNTAIITKGDLQMPIIGIPAMRPAAFMAELEKRSAAPGLYRAKMLVIHQAIAEFCDFGKTELTALQIAEHAAKLGIEYVAMGDIHVYQETVIGGVRFAYPGSIEMNSTSEPQNKSAVLIEYDGLVVRTGVVPLAARPFVDVTLESEVDLESLLLKVNPATQPLVILRYDSKQHALAHRAEAVLKAHALMYRLCPVGSGTNSELRKQLSQQGFERNNALVQLKEAVAAYFDETSDEYQLVFQLLDNPDTVPNTVTTYLTSKGVTL